MWHSSHYDKFVKVQHDLQEVKQERLLAEFHVTESVMKKLPCDIKADFIKAEARAERDGGTNPATGDIWERHEILAIFLEEQISISRKAVKVMEDTSTTTPKDIRCHGCNKTGHIQAKCPDKPKAGKTDNALTHSGGKACAHCKEADGHTFKDKTNTAVRTKRLYCCPKFMQLGTVKAKAKVIQDLSGCFLCTDTSHKTDDCKSPYLCRQD